METVEISRVLRIAKIYQALLILSIPIFLGILIRFREPSPFYFSYDNLKLITIVLAIFGVLGLAYIYLLPRFMMKRYEQKPTIKKLNILVFVFIVRAGLLEAVAIYGLIVGIFGARLEIVALFFIASVAGLLLTFPTINKWDRMSEMLEGRTGEGNKIG